MRREAIRILILPLVLAVVASASCDSGRSVTLPLEPGTSIAFSRSPVGWSGMTKADLKALEKSEKERVKAEKERRHAETKALHQQWEDFKHLGYSKDRGDSPLLVCEPHDYDAAVAIIGPEGGELTLGGQKLIVPAGALSAYTVITMEMPASLHLEVEFSPHGTFFDKSLQLQLDYKNCFVPKGERPAIVYVDDNDNILEWPLSIDLKHLGIVFGWIDHFSKYAMASN